jgi:tetraacyldisaccharide 4'-kinase
MEPDKNRKTPLEKIYEWGDKINKWLKSAKKFENIKVISIGNITAGGTGKTPAAIYFAKILQSESFKTAILTRGYGGSKSSEGAELTDGKQIFLTAEESGDEPMLLANNLPDIPIGVGRNRFEMGNHLLSKHDINLFLLDDGFQHYALHRDVDVVLIDGTNPFGNGHLLPHGILREPIEELQRADIIIISKSDLVEDATLEELSNYLKKISGNQFIFYASHTPTCLVKISKKMKKSEKKLTTIKNESVWALSGIGNHGAFEKTLHKLGTTSVKNITFRDHHNYSEKDIASILKRVQEYDFVITTEKDYIKLRKFEKQFSKLKNFYYLKIEFKIIDHEILLKEGLKAKLLTGKI